MGRARYSQGYVKLTPTNLWQANWFPYVIDPSTGHEKRIHRTQIVGQAPKMRKYEAEKELRKIVEPQAQAVATFGWFMKNRWIPMKEGGWRPSSKQSYAPLIASLEARFGTKPLPSMDKVEMQAWLNETAKSMSGSTVRRLRVLLKSIMAEAVDQDYLAKDPSRKLIVPKGMPKSDKTILTWEQLRTIFSMLPQRDQLILMIEITVGLRPSELFALRRKSFTGTQLVITETIYRGKLREYGKTDGSLTSVDLPSPLASQLTEWLAGSGDGVSPLVSADPGDGASGIRLNAHQERGISSPDSFNPEKISALHNGQTVAQPSNSDPTPDDFIFPSSTGNFIQKDNYLMRVLYPIRKSLGLPKLNFQVLRRTFATLAQKHGSVKDIQRQLRHTTPGLTVNTYMQAIPESVQSMVESMYQAMIGPKGIQ